MTLTIYVLAIVGGIVCLWGLITIGVKAWNVFINRDERSRLNTHVWRMDGLDNRLRKLESAIVKKRK